MLYYRDAYWRCANCQAEGAILDLSWPTTLEDLDSGETIDIKHTIHNCAPGVYGIGYFYKVLPHEEERKEAGSV